MIASPAPASVRGACRLVGESARAVDGGRGFRASRLSLLGDRQFYFVRACCWLSALFFCGGFDSGSG